MPTSWGNITYEDVTINCAGITGTSGTGRWKYVETIKDGNGNVQEVLFNETRIIGRGFKTLLSLCALRHADAQEASMRFNNTLDVVIGDGVLHPADVENFGRNKVPS